MKAVIKKKKLHDTVGNLDDLANMFNQMIGIDNVNVPISYNKYTTINTTVMRIIEAMEMLGKLKYLNKYDDIRPTLTALLDECTKMRAEHKTLFSVDLSEYLWNLKLAPQDKIDQFLVCYKTVQTSMLIKNCMFICNNLWPYKKYIEDENKLDYRFILSMPGVEWCPLVFTTLNIKYILSIEGMPKDICVFFITFLNKVFKLCEVIYDMIHTPDIDIDALGAQLIDNICTIEQIPELSNCKLVFSEIRNNIDMFKKNFNGYYQGFVSSKNKMSILFDFISDIGANKPNNTKLMFQIRKVLSYYRKVLGPQINDPTLMKVLKQVDKTLGELDKTSEAPDDNREEVQETPEELPEADEIVISSAMNLKDITQKKS